MRKSIGGVLKEASELPTPQAKIEFLRKHDHSGLRGFLELALNPHVVWLLPEGEPPYTPCPFLESEGVLYKELRKLYLFLEGGNTNLIQRKREALFIQLLEAVTPEDAELLIAVKDKKFPYTESLSNSLLREAFGGLNIPCEPFRQEVTVPVAPKARNQSGYVGVHWDKQKQRWIAKINVNKKQIQLGSFKNAEDASKAYQDAVVKYKRKEKELA